MIFLMLSLLVGVADGKLVGAAVMPHGDFAYDPTLFQRYADYDPNATRISYDLFRGSKQVGDYIASLNPDTIVVTTPHGLETDWDLGIYSNQQLKGTATVGRDLDESYCSTAGCKFPEYTVKSLVRGDIELGRAIGGALSKRNANSTSILGWNDVIPLPMHWGEVLPLGLIPTNGTSKVVIIGLPLSRHNYSSLVAGGFESMGQTIGSVLDASPKRIVLVVSTDLAHRHWANTTMGFSPYARVFDDTVGHWATTLNTTSLMVESKRWVDEVYSCGWLGLCLLHGALEQTGLAEWNSTLTAEPQHPTYYGMMAALFKRAPGTPV